MLRSHPTRRYRRVSGFNSAAEVDDHLRDDVVAMFRGSFDEDGLDFLKRGPRTAQERLAYAQRVRPDAHLTARPAPLDVQRCFVDHGVIDQNRYFIGPDRAAYLRSHDSAEPGHAAMRRGFESTVGGFTPVSFDQALAEIDGATGAGIVLEDGRDGIGYLADRRPVQPDVQLTDGAEQGIDQIEKRYQAYAEYGRRHGHDEAAAVMERFLSGSGQAMRLDPSWLRSVLSVREAEVQVRRYFEEWMTGDQPSKTASEQIVGNLVALPEGATLRGGSTWTRRFTPSLLFEWNALATVGQTNLTGTGNFNFRREGDRIHFEGVVAMLLDDTYDWQPGEWGLVPRPDELFPWIEQNRHDDAIKLQNYRSAKPFKIFSQWWKNVRGTMVVRDKQLTLETIHWQDRQR
jgi:hypothetical protein